MNVLVFDTETTNLEKPFCYNVGYVIFDTDTNSTLVEKDFVVEQVWHNLPLFESAYYKEKRPLYIKAMRAHRTKMDKWGYIMGEMKRDIKKFDIQFAYAYNSPFDDKVFSFNCDWFKVMNPLEEIPILDIRGLANNFITNLENYKVFCEDNDCFTESGNYSTTAESVYKYIMDEPDFEEAHTALEDSRIEKEILVHCLKMGSDLGIDYPVQKILARPRKIPIIIEIDKQIIFEGEYISKYIRDGKYKFKTR